MIELGAVLLFAVLFLFFSAVGRKRSIKNLRPIPAFKKLGEAIELAVEDGTRIHVSLGRSSITSPRSAAAMVGLSVLGRIAQVASVSDQPPIATSGDGTLTYLSQDTLLKTYRAVGALDRYNASSGRLAGVTPFSYAAGVLPIVDTEKVSANVLLGSFGTEVALITDHSERQNVFTLAGSDSIPAQAILYATAEEPLIGEELYAAGAYTNAGPAHFASLRAQDVMRWLLVVFILASATIKFLGSLQ